MYSMCQRYTRRRGRQWNRWLHVVREVTEVVRIMTRYDEIIMWSWLISLVCSVKK